MTPTQAQAIRAHTSGVLRSRRAYQLEPTAVGDLGCVTCAEPTGEGVGCKTCQKTREKREKRAKARRAA